MMAKPESTALALRSAICWVNHPFPELTLGQRQRREVFAGPILRGDGLVALDFERPCDDLLLLFRKPLRCVSRLPGLPRLFGLTIVFPEGSNAEEVDVGTRALPTGTVVGGSSEVGNEVARFEGPFLKEQRMASDKVTHRAAPGVKRNYLFLATIDPKDKFQLS
jgi:hypothetical protein